MEKTNLSKRREIFLLLIILLFSLAARSAVFLSVYSKAPSRILSSDSPSYDNSAKALLRIGRFTVSPNEPDSPQTIRTPGYPAFIAAVYFIFGEKQLPVILIQILISVGTILITYLIARSLWDSGAALLGVLLSSLYIIPFVYSQRLLTETLFTALFLLAVLSGVRLILGKGSLRKNGLFLGITLALAALVRPVGYYLVFPVIIGFFLFGKSVSGSRQEITLLLFLIAISWVILVGGWQLRNFLLTGSAEFSNIKSINLLSYRAAGIIARRDNITREEAKEKLFESLPDTESLSNSEVYKLYAEKGLSVIRRYPLIYISGAAQTAVYTMLSPGDNLLMWYLGLIKKHDMKARPWRDLFKLPFPKFIHRWLVDRPYQFALFLFSMAFLFITYACLASCLWQIIIIDRAMPVVHIFILGVIIYMFIVSMGPSAEAGTRFMIPVMPLLTIYSGKGLDRLFESFQRQRKE